MVSVTLSYRITERVSEIDAMLLKLTKQGSEPEVGRFLYFDCKIACWAFGLLYIFEPDMVAEVMTSNHKTVYETCISWKTSSR